MKRLLFLIVLFIATQANATVRYVDNSQSCPGSGTTGSPWCSIQQALTSMSSGDDVKIRTGTGVYSETAFISAKSGSSGTPNILEPDTGANFVIRNTSTGNFTASIKVKESDYWIFRNLVFDGAGVNPSIVALHVQCETKNCVGIEVRNNTFRNWTQQVGASFGPDVLYIAGCHVDLGCAAPTKTITAIIDSNTFQNNDLDSMELLTTLNTVVSNNTVTGQRCGRNSDTTADNSAMHITYYNYGLQIFNNSFHDFVPVTSCPLSNGGDMVSAGTWSDVCYFDENTKVYNNTVYNIDSGRNNLNGVNGATSHFAAAFFVEAGCWNYQVHNNQAWNIGNFGIISSNHSLPGNMVANTYYNNTFYNVQNGFFLKEGVVTIKNNIVKNATDAAVCLGCGSGSPASVVMTSDYNDFDDGGSQTKIGTKNGTTYNLANWRIQGGGDAHSIAVNPLFVSLITPDFHLQTSPVASPAINTGTDVGLPFTGSAPDMGAFESGTAASGVISWANSRTGGTGTGVGTANWTISNIPLLSGLNPITVTATDSSGNAGMSGIGVTYAPTFPGNTAVALYGLETGSGTSAVDSSGNSNTGTLINGATWTASGKFGNAIQFDGTNQYIQVADSGSFGVTQSFGVSAWVNPSSVHTDFRSILEKDSQTLPNPPIAFYASVGPWPGCSPGVPAIYLNVNGALGPLTWVCAASPLPTNTWSHVAATYDFATLKLFVNGSLVASSTATGYIEPGTGTVYVGASQYGEYFQGSLDEVRFYNWGIPLTAGSNTSPGAACVFGNPLDPLQQSVVRDMNCPVIQTTPPLAFKLPASATGLKLQGTLKLGNQ